MQYRRLISVVLVSLIAVLVVGCDRDDADDSTEKIAEKEDSKEELSDVAALQQRANLVFEPIPLEVDDVDEDKVELGRAIFHDKNLSADGTVSCATCHAIEDGGGDNLPTSIGIDDQVVAIHSPTVLNARYHFKQFWDGRESTLEDQASGPVEDPKEMGNTWEAVVEYLAETDHYAEHFERLYDDGVTEDNAVHAIAEFERTLITPNAPFDQFLRGDEDALNEQERAGLKAFMDTGCTSCHGGKILSDDTFHKMGAVHDYFGKRDEITDADKGRYNVTGDEADMHHFKVPTLRNVELTWPYFHHGEVETLEEAVEKMAWYQLGVELDEETVDDMVAFMKSLTGDIPDVSTDPIPAL